MPYSAEYRYTKDHQWVKKDGNRLRVGITEHAQAELGDIVFVELPSLGSEVRKGQAVATVESVKAVGDVTSPVSGKIVEINQDLESAPETVNASPHDAGWVFVAEMTDPSDLDDTMDAAAYEAFLSNG
ncbi:MAG TPA: glycine cleavage system protein GcvH [Candidatus Acetothermia bacterium]|nr:glycine cleavage system protein GcvH [Candidatus Acetothermia bacterium]